MGRRCSGWAAGWSRGAGGCQATITISYTRRTTMRKIIASEYVSLEGVMDMEAAEQWHFPFWNDELANYAHDLLFASDALLLGRVTYQGFAATWPSVSDEQGFAD